MNFFGRRILKAIMPTIADAEITSVSLRLHTGGSGKSDLKFDKFGRGWFLNESRDGATLSCKTGKALQRVAEVTIDSPEVQIHELASGSLRYRK